MAQRWARGTSIPRELNFDVGAAYIWVKDPSINNAGNPASVTANGLIDGTYSNYVWIVSAQVELSMEVSRA